MALLDSLIIGLGSAVAKGVAKRWLAEDPELQEVAVDMSSVVAHRFKDIRGQRELLRQFERISDRVAETIHQAIIEDANDLTEAQAEKVANAASDTISYVSFSSDILVQQNLDPAKLSEYFLSKKGSEGGNPAGSFQYEEKELYIRLIVEASQLIVDISSQLPELDGMVQRELLN